MEKAKNRGNKKVYDEIRTSDVEEESELANHHALILFYARFYKYYIYIIYYNNF